MGGACVRCGEDRLAALTIHHPPGVTRTHHHRTSSGGGTIWHTALTDDEWDEVDQCELLCSNCHQLHHASSYGRMTALELNAHYSEVTSHVPTHQAAPCGA